MLASRFVAPAASALGDARSSFAVIDDVAQRPTACGLLTIALGDGAMAPLARHIARRAEIAGRNVLVVGLGPSSEVWRELALGLRVLDTHEPAALARRIARAAAGSVLVVLERRQTSWGRAVGEELERLTQDEEARLLLVLLQPPAKRGLREPQRLVQPLTSLGSSDGAGPLQLRVEIDALSTADRRRWWEAIIARDELCSSAALASLESLDNFWEATRWRPIPAEPWMPPLSPIAEELWGYTLRAEETLTEAQAAALGSIPARAELCRLGLLLPDGSGRVRPRDGVAALSAPEPERDRRLAQVLLDESLGDGTDVDAWTTMRAAELLGACGDVEMAEQAALRSVGLVQDAAARDDLWSRWSAVLAALTATPGHLERLLRGAERALELSDGERADELARLASTLDGNRFDVLLLRGRSSAARGDLTTAKLVLQRALAQAPDPASRARAGSAMAEVRYLAGEHADAETEATEAVAQAGEAATRLDARNTLGKLLLGLGRFAEAEHHFAADAYDAAGERLIESELRARLNRAIAVLSLGRREDARRMFSEVLTDGEAHGSLRAVAYALSNLATIAIAEHAYDRALALSERAIEVRHKLGERMGLVRPITNLAELRLRLGLVDEAEQALRFGLQACGRNLPAALHAYFALVAARIHLARGETVEATRELGQARAAAACSGDGGMVGECERLGTRLALEDGDLERAEVSLQAARERTPLADANIELAVLTARWRRAAGEPFEDEARLALTLAQRSGDAEHAREAYVLLCNWARNLGDQAAASRYLEGALGERDRIANALPTSLRSRFLGRTDLSALSELESDRQRQPACRVVGLDAVDEPRGPLPPMRPTGRVLLGESPAMRALRSAIDRIGPTESTVLIHGETGTGKELVAEAIHRASRRSEGPLVKVNCAALVETLLLSELFGHERGAFTGATTRRRGRFELADGGTLFLDEIGDISPRTQVALLRVLQDGTFERVGGSTTIHTNVRVVCATHRDLKAMVERGEFREDLYYRLCGVGLEVPALRERPGDVPVLARALLRDAQKASGLEPKPIGRDALSALARHPWPGNVRELENALRVAGLFARGEEIDLADFTDNVEGLRHLKERASGSGARSDAGQDRAAPPSHSPDSSPSWPPPSGPDSVVPCSTDVVYAEVRMGTSLGDLKHRLEQECIARALAEAGGNITRAATLLGMKRPRLSQLVKQYQLGTVVVEEKKS